MRRSLTILMFVFLGTIAVGAQNGFDRKRLTVTKTEKSRYRGFLDLDNTGITKIWNNPCAENKVVDARDPLCGQRTDVTFGAHYSFYLRVYFEKLAHVNYSALSLSNGEFFVRNHSRLAQLIVDLGQLSAESVDGTLAAVKSVGKFPLIDQSARQSYNSTRGGYDFESLFLTDRTAAVIGHSYALRSIFEDRRGFASGAKGAQLRDGLYVFTVVAIDGDVVTLLWRKIKIGDVRRERK